MNPSSIPTQHNNRRLLIILSGATLLLLLPLIGMAISNEVNWTGFDFIVAGILLYGTGLSLELLLRKLRTTRARVVGAIVLFALLFLVWAELAVGIFGSPFAGS